jgi:hypothetical protein
MKKNVIIGIIAAAIIIPAAYAASPLFINTRVDEPLPVSTVQDSASDKSAGDAMLEVALAGTFVGVGDGVHNAQGSAKVLAVDGKNILRLENFGSTNGPDLYVYLATDKNASDFVDLGRLKANTGNQNYDIPQDTDLSRYDTVLIWCKAFSVLFGSAQLSA